MTWRRAITACVIAAVGALQPTSPAVANEATTCGDAGRQAEESMHLPPGLLIAIGQTESGRRDPITGRLAAWPWTINANGAGRWFETSDAVLTETRALLAHGVASVDVGCFQINLLHHPLAFLRLEDAFDPQANAAYAARFLAALHVRTGSWEGAVAAYHSATPERGEPYRNRVWALFKTANVQPDVLAPPVARTLIWSPTPATGPVRVWTPSANGFAPTMIVIRPSPAQTNARLPTVRVGMITPQSDDSAWGKGG